MEEVWEELMVGIIVSHANAIISGRLKLEEEELRVEWGRIQSFFSFGFDLDLPADPLAASEIQLLHGMPLGEDRGVPLAN